MTHDASAVVERGNDGTYGGGNKVVDVDAYPLELTGVIINLVPLSSSVHAPKDLPAVKGYLLYDDLRITYYQ